MRAGPLRHLAILQRAEISRDARGQDITQWIDLEAIWAHIRPLSGRELEAAKQINAESTWKMTTRYIHGLEIRTTDRIGFDGMTFDITDVRDVEYQARMIEVGLKRHAA